MKGPKAKSYMLKEEFQSALKALGYDENSAAMHLHLHRSTINRMANGRSTIDAPLALLLNYMVHFGKLPRSGWRYGKPLFFKEHG